MNSEDAANFVAGYIGLDIEEFGRPVTTGWIWLAKLTPAPDPKTPNMPQLSGNFYSTRPILPIQ